MTGQPLPKRDIRGKQLHPDIARRVVNHFDSRHYEEAVFNAFKVVDDRLRQITGTGAVDPMELIKLAFNPATGILKDDRAYPGEREGLHLLIRGAFMAYRNPMGHRFVDPSKEEAFDLIVLANRIYVIIEDAYQRTQLGGAVPQPPVTSYNRVNYDDPIIYQLDADNDVELETIVPSYGQGKIVAIFDNTPNGPQAASIDDDAAIGAEIVQSVVLADIDNDGLNELVCVLGWASSTGLVCLKYRNGRYEILRRKSPTDANAYQPYTIDAQIVDVDGDGQLEIVSEPWGSIPESFIPADYVPEPGFGPDGDKPWGRVRSVWRWNRALDGFELLEEKLSYIGGR